MSRHVVENRPDANFPDRPLAERRLWVARAILASHRFPIGDGPGKRFNGAFLPETWHQGALQTDSVILKLAGGPLGLNRPIHFCVVFAEGTSEPTRLICNRGSLLGKVGLVSIHRPVGENPYRAGHPFDLWTPGKESPTRITWSFALKALHDAVGARSLVDREVHEARVLLDSFGAMHGNQLDKDVMGMPIASRRPEEMLEGEGCDTELGRALKTCLDHADLGESWQWVKPAIATLWATHGRRIHALYNFPPDAGHDAAEDHDSTQPSLR